MFDACPLLYLYSPGGSCALVYANYPPYCMTGASRLVNARTGFCWRRHAERWRCIHIFHIFIKLGRKKIIIFDNNSNNNNNDDDDDNNNNNKFKATKQCMIYQVFRGGGEEIEIHA